MTNTDAFTGRIAGRHDSMPALMTTTLHIGPEHVSATDLTEHRRVHTPDSTGDLASLTLGDRNTKVVLLGSLAELRSLLTAAADQLDTIEPDRRPTFGADDHTTTGGGS